MLDNWGIVELGKHLYDESIGEMKDADHLIERVLYLDGTPNLQRVGLVEVGESPLVKLNAALELERAAIDRHNNGIALCTDRGDHGIRHLQEHPRR